MRVVNRFFYSSVGRRIFCMFVACALIPSSLFAVLAYRNVTSQINNQNSVELKQSTENYAYSIYERLLILDNDLQTAASLVKPGSQFVGDDLPVKLKQRLQNHFKLIAFSTGEKGYQAILGHDMQLADLTASLVRVKNSKKTQIEIHPSSTGLPNIILLQFFDGMVADGGALIGIINQEYLWDMESNKSLPLFTNSYIIYKNHLLYSTAPVGLDLPDEVKTEISRSQSGYLETSLAGEKYIAGYWSLFLKSDFSSPSWNVVLLKSRQNVLVSVKSFQTTFVFVVLTTFMLVLLLSMNSIQKIINPLEKLKEATGRITQRDFQHKVTVAGNDEFGELAEAFNVMTGELDRQFVAKAKLLQELKELNWGSLMAFARTVDAKSPWTAGHSARVTRLALEIAGAMGFSDQERDNLHRAGLLHDIGKIGVPVKLLDKPAQLSPAEQRTIRDHPEIGARILEPIKAYRDIIPLVRQHHERFDGKGYPDGLKGEEISLGGRILAVADTYDACVSDRPYRTGMHHDRALEILMSESGHQFDPRIVRIFVDMYSEKHHNITE